MAKLNFDHLGTDNKALVVEKISRPTDLKNVCLTNKEFHELAVKPLYRSVNLDLGSSHDHRLAAFLSPKNIGLRHIKKLWIGLADTRDKCCREPEQQAHLVIRMILEFLPEDTLEEFSWCPWKPFSTENLLLLYKKQRKLKELEVMDLDRDILPELKRHEQIHGEMFKHVNSLSLFLASRQSLRASNFYMQKTKEVLEDLTIYSTLREQYNTRDGSLLSDSIGTRELNDSATAPGLLTSTIFGDMMPLGECEPLKQLKTLRLSQVSLRYCADTWCKVIDFTRIELLEVSRCSGADSFFGELSKAKNLPRQLETLEFSHDDNAMNEALLALDGFLCLTSGIQKLVIDLDHVKTMPAAAGIARHGKTLESLNVHCAFDPSSDTMTSSDDESQELVWRTEDFEKICKACTSLEQLSCAWPMTSLIRAPSEDWRAFERACSNLKELLTLNITSFPNNKPSSQLLPRTIYETLLQSIAQKTFEVSSKPKGPSQGSSSSDDDEDTASTTPVDIPPRSSKLRLVAFGISDKLDEREDSKNLKLYLRSSCRDALGRRQVYAAPIGWNMCKYVAEREILEYDLRREARPPCRDVRDSGLSWRGDDDDESVGAFP